GPVRRRRWVQVRGVLAGVAVAVVLSACSTGWQHRAGEQHVVRRGETLFTIAWRYGRDHRDLARWNGLGDGSLIYPGQVIRLVPPSGGRAPAVRSTPRSAPPLPKIAEQPSPSWTWPTPGSVAVAFGGRPGSGTGILIGGRSGQPVVAAADGRVVYSGGGLIGYGQLIIVKHNDTYLSAYGHNSTLLVTEGDSVRQGQRIATMGEGPGRQPRLHFEIRRNGKPVDPRDYLPAR
ncbi:MAG: peptidoglycan DD-metalloendopeptidase family protein, partial [Woeseiaceae bacterium]|nr:peptidoglycan DD-metalloendopeptidase family protein [Woeseiaceae bacterium]